MADRLNVGVAARLSRYLQVLTQARKMGKARISSQEIAEYANINATQIRRDLSTFGKFGKRGVGYCKSTIGAVRPFQRLVERNKPQPTDRLFPKTHRELFNTILDDEGLKTDREGQPRTAYSLRHTYICLRLMEGADIYQIAKNCRTSVEMIEKYYASHLKNTLDAAAINVMRKKAKKNEHLEEEEG